MRIICGKTKNKGIAIIAVVLVVLVFGNLFTSNTDNSVDKEIYTGGSLPVQIVSADENVEITSNLTGVAGFIDSTLLLKDEKLEINGWLEFQPSTALIVTSNANIVDSNAIWYNRSDLQGQESRKGFSLLLSMNLIGVEQKICLEAASSATERNDIVGINGTRCLSISDFK